MNENPLNETLFPPHKASLHLTHNQHKAYYQSAAEYIGDRESLGDKDNPRVLFKDDAAKQRAIDTNEVWELQWYPDTPVGSYEAFAPTLSELLARAKEIAAQ